MVPRWRPLVARLSHAAGLPNPQASPNQAISEEQLGHPLDIGLDTSGDTTLDLLQEPQHPASQLLT